MMTSGADHDGQRRANPPHAPRPVQRRTAQDRRRHVAVIHGRADEGGERFRQRAHRGAWESQGGRRDSGAMQTDGGNRSAWPMYKIIFNKYFFRSRRLLKQICDDCL